MESRNCVRFSVIRLLLFLQRIWKHLGATCEEFPYLSWTPLVNIKILWAFSFFFFSCAKGGNEVGKESLVMRFEVFIEAKIHPTHIRHNSMETYGGGVRSGGISTLKFNIDPRKGYVATKSQCCTLKEKARIVH